MSGRGAQRPELGLPRQAGLRDEGDVKAAQAERDSGPPAHAGGLGGWVTGLTRLKSPFRH